MFMQLYIGRQIQIQILIQIQVYALLQCHFFTHKATCIYLSIYIYIYIYSVYIHAHTIYSFPHIIYAFTHTIVCVCVDIYACALLLLYSCCTTASLVSINASVLLYSCCTHTLLDYIYSRAFLMLVLLCAYGYALLLLYSALHVIYVI